MRPILLTSLFLLMMSALWANCSLDSANAFFEKKQYSEAIREYTRQIDAGCQTHDHEYNLGNAYFEIHDLGNAILHYERALKIRPRDRDTRYNLITANARILDQFRQPSEFFLLKVWNRVRDSFGSLFWGIVSIILFFITIASIFIWLFHPKRNLKKWSFLSAFPLLLCSVLLIVFALQKSHNEHSKDNAIVLVESVSLLTIPNEKGEVLREVHSGTKVKILSRTGLYDQVTLPDGQKGWLATESHTPI